MGNGALFFIPFSRKFLKEGAFMMRRANGDGCVYKLRGKRRKLWAARVTVG